MADHIKLITILAAATVLASCALFVAVERINTLSKQCYADDFSDYTFIHPDGSEFNTKEYEYMRYENEEKRLA